MQLFLARHGRTAANAAGLLLGRADPPLDATGQAQAEALGRVLGPAARPVRVVSSPLQRTRSTAEAIAAGLGGVDVEIDERWVELDYGEFDGRPAGDVPADTWRRWRTEVHFTPPGGESLGALGQRVRAACEELLAVATAADQGPATTVVVSHVSPIKAAVAWALGVGDEVAWRLYLAPASLTTLRLERRGVALTGYNLVDHLPGVGSAR